MSIISGPMMLLKQLGLDPEAITKQIQDYGAIVIALKQQMDRMEENQNKILFYINSTNGNGADLEIPAHLRRIQEEKTQ